MYIYIFLLFYFTIHLIMTEARLKRRVLPLVFIVKSFTKSLLIRLLRIVLIMKCCSQLNVAYFGYALAHVWNGNNWNNY